LKLSVLNNKQRARALLRKNGLTQTNKDKKKKRA